MINKINEIRKKTIEYLKKHKSITIAEYIGLNKISDKTARRDLNELVRKEMIIKEGITTNVVFKLRSTSVNFGQGSGRK